MKRAHAAMTFRTIRTEGGLLPVDLLQRVAAEDKQLSGLTAEAYHLDPGERVRDAVNRAWTRLTAAWRSFQTALAKLPEKHPATAETREKWLLPLFDVLGYGRLAKMAAQEIEGKSYPISHGWGSSPVHLLGSRVDLDTRQKGVAGAASVSPHGLVQDFLNRSDGHLWGFVSNGLALRILRDHHSLTQQAYVEFDLHAMMEGAEFSDFRVLWLLCHQSRVEAERPEDCHLEKWFQTARDEGVRALDSLRDGVEKAIEHLGSGFLKHKANERLHRDLKEGTLDKQDYYRQLLRLVYRLIFVFVAEERGALLLPEREGEPAEMAVARDRYQRFYATRRLRDLAEKRRGGPHGDLWQSLRLVLQHLSEGSSLLALPALGSFLFHSSATPDLNAVELANEDLLKALLALCYIERGKMRFAVSYRNVGSEELGSVYESLLERHPRIHRESGVFELSTAAGHERKTTGSYYTPRALVDCLLDSALDPVLDEAAKKADAEKAILDLKVCDPACGSGHFLVAASRRIALRLASVRTGGDEPSPPEVQKALRDVVGRCIYGVDLNPMAVELCKVSLWMEAIEPGKPLSFLEAHIRQGNALLGTTPALMERGIPDEAYEAIEGDDKEVAKRLKKRNRDERKGKQRTLFADFAKATEPVSYGRLASGAAAVEAAADDTLPAIRKKEEEWDRFTQSEEYRSKWFKADAWCAAFVWPKQAGPLEDGAITQDLWLRLKETPEVVSKAARREVQRLAREYSFFHWHQAFPQVFQVDKEKCKREGEATGWNGGFDVVLGNPPWERVKLQEQEFFAPRSDEIANAPNAAARKKLISALARSTINIDLDLWAEWCAASRQAQGQSHLVRQSGRYPLCGRGDVNTYALFAEHNRAVLGPGGRAGFIVPTGIATDDTTKEFFSDLMSQKHLAAFYGFENEAKLFAGIDHRVNFCLMVLWHGEMVAPKFAAFLREPSLLADPERVYPLTAEDIALLNPNTRTCPVFRTRRDAEINLALYRRAGVLWREDDPRGNPWRLRFMRMLDMANDSGLFRTRRDLSDAGCRLVESRFEGPDDRYLPLYEAKMVHHFNHRFGDFALLEPGEREHILPQVSDDRLVDAGYLTLPRYWVANAEADTRLAGAGGGGWLLGWRDVTDSRSSARTVVACIIPRTAVSGKFPCVVTMVPNGWLVAATLSSFALDYAARQKLGGVSLSMFIMRQLPVLAPDRFAHSPGWDTASNVTDWLLPRVLELTYTAWDLEPFARDVGYDGPPFRWDPARRILLRAELDAAYFHLYGISREDTAYILETFPIVRRNDEKACGEYRTKRVILEVYDSMQRAIETGVPYQTLLDPPPADPRVAHPPRENKDA